MTVEYISVNVQQVIGNVGLALGCEFKSTDMKI